MSLPLPFSILVLLTVLLPWVNAGIDLPVRPFLYGLLGVAVIAQLAEFVRQRRLPQFNLPWLISLLAIGLFCLSLVPLPVNSLPATSLSWWYELTGQSSGTISLHPSETRIQLSLLCACSVALFVASQIKIDKRRLEVLGYAMLVNGTLITIFAFVQRYTWDNRLYWTFSVPTNDTTFGPMVYHNFAGAYLVLCAAIGSLAVSSCLRDKRSFSQIDARSAATLLMLANILVGLFCSLSRGAILSATVGATLVAYRWVTKSRPTANWIWSLPFLCCLAGGMFWFGMSDAVVDRLGTFTSGEVLEDQRLLHWSTAAQAIPDFWLWGCGGGAYGRVVGTYETQPDITFFFRHAHNQYLETLVANGIFGLLLLLTFGILVMRSAWRLNQSREAAHAAVGYLGCFVISTTAIHAVVDYCLLAPAICLPVSILSGLVISCERRRSPVRLPLAWISCGLLIVASAWTIYDASTAARVDLANRSIPLGAVQSQIPPPLLATATHKLESALEWRPDSLVGWEALGTLQIVKYRQNALHQLSQETQIATTDPNLWQWTSPEVLHHRVHTLRRAGQSDLLDELRAEPSIAQPLGEAHAAFLAARAACPLWANAHLRIEELTFLNPEVDITSSQNADRILKVAGNDPRILFESGNREFGAGRYESAYRCWNRSLTHSSRYLQAIAQLSLEHLTTAQFLSEVLPNRLSLLLRLVELSTEFHAFELDGPTVRANGERLAIPPSELPDIPEALHEQAQLAMLLGQPSQSVAYLERALQLDPTKVAWRFELAQQLASAGKFKEAEKHAIRCVRKRNWVIYRTFLAKLREDMRAREAEN